MANANALFKRYWKEYCGGSESFSIEQNQQRAVLFAACIIAEAMKIELEDVDQTLTVPHPNYD